ncbi:MAG: ABC transporter permease, partial [Bacillota bacterium]
MRSYYLLTLAQLRIFLRNRQVLFWTLAFPIVLMVMLGSFLGNGNGVSITAAVVDQDKSEQSKNLVKEMEKNEAVSLEKSSNEKDVLDQLKQGDLTLVITIPKGYGENLAGGNKADP